MASQPLPIDSQSDPLSPIPFGPAPVPAQDNKNSVATPSVDNFNSTVTSDSHPTRVQMPTGHVIAFPASMDLSAVTQATQNIWEQTKQGVGTLAESFGLPANMQQVREANKNLPTQLAHPLDTMKQVARQTAAS